MGLVPVLERPGLGLEALLSVQPEPRDAVKTLNGRICPMELCGRRRGMSKRLGDEMQQGRETNAHVSLRPENQRPGERQQLLWGQTLPT